MSVIIEIPNYSKHYQGHFKTNNIRTLAILLYKIIVLPSDVTHGYKFEV